jgi:cytochrome d ubiquinol oxidase subunit II
LTGTATGRSAAVITAVVHLAGLWALVNAFDRLARFLAAGGALAILWGWALSQYPFLVEPSVSIYDAAPTSTLDLLLASLIAGSAVLFPFLYYLYRLFKGEVLSLPGS